MNRKPCSMITKWIEFTVAPGTAATFEAELAQLEVASKAEPGCAYYAAFRKADTPNAFTVLEIWETTTAFEAHRSAPHTSGFKDRCAEMITAKSAQSLESLGAG